MARDPAGVTPHEWEPGTLGAAWGILTPHLSPRAPFRPDAMSTPYRPIACALHDELQLRALRRARVTVRYRSTPGPGHAASAPDVRELEGRVVDVRTRDGAEYLVLAQGDEIRLDRLVDVDGVAFGDAC